MWGADEHELEAPWMGRLRAIMCTLCVLAALAAGFSAIVALLALGSSDFLPLGILFAGGALCIGLMLWLLAMFLAPRYTITLLVVTTVALLLVLPLPCWLLSSREEARRTQAVNNIRQLGLQMFYQPTPGEVTYPLDYAAPQLDRFGEPIPDSITLSSGQRYPAYEP